jgi:hypothetical protein
MFYEEVTTAPTTKPSRMSLTRVKISRSPPQTNHNGEINTMQGCKARTPRKFTNPFLSNLTKATNATEELEKKNNKGGQPMIP